MPVKVGIEVANHREGDALKLAMSEPALKIAMLVNGLLLELPEIQQRRAVVSFALSTVAELPPASVPPLRLHAATDTGE